jgi:hypothetical protein
VSPSPLTIGCSSLLGRWLQRGWPKSWACCELHDKDYRGGVRRRQIVDLEFLICLLHQRVPVSVAILAYYLVRLFGWPYWRAMRMLREGGR